MEQKTVELQVGSHKVILDSCDVPLLMKYYRSVRKIRNCWYCILSSRHDNKTTYAGLLHRKIMGDPPGLVVDHIDGDGLNCSRSNLRCVTHAQNLANRVERRSFSKTGLFGVYYEIKKKRWNWEFRLARQRFRGHSYKSAAHAALLREQKLNELNNTYNRRNA